MQLPQSNAIIPPRLRHHYLVLLWFGQHGFMILNEPLRLFLATCLNYLFQHLNYLSYFDRFNYRLVIILYILIHLVLHCRHLN